ncbi:MAG: phospho-N-acetylmuramoyl-pentapeptide-transferase [Candidatus Omnitrophota bacterium]
MFYSLFYSFKELFSAFNVIKYITVRSSLAIVTSFLLSVILGHPIINRLKILKIGENIKKKSCEALFEIQHHKQGTPTMGGILIILSVLISTFFWADLSNQFIQISIFSTIWLSSLGFIDDYLKLKRKSSSGLKARIILFGQICLAFIVASLLLSNGKFDTNIYVPFFKEISLNFGLFFIPFVILVIVGSSNAVNLTDGLDGLASGCMIMVSLAYSVLSYIAGHKIFSNYLLIPYISSAGELTIFCASIFGAVLGFLWFNCYPANVFMGNVGSLTLGGVIGLVAVLIKQEFLLVIVGGVFVMEAVSVLLQVASFRLKKKRLFKMAPLHHHFQLLGWPESKIIVRFWIISSILALLALATLKVR